MGVGGRGRRLKSWMAPVVAVYYGVAEEGRCESTSANFSGAVAVTGRSAGVSAGKRAESRSRGRLERGLHPQPSGLIGTSALSSPPLERRRLAEGDAHLEQPRQRCHQTLCGEGDVTVALSGTIHCGAVDVVIVDLILQTFFLVIQELQLSSAVKRQEWQ